jgi:predicted transposase YdaD
MEDKKKQEKPKYKDTVFRALFGYDPALLKELYEAIEGVKISPDTEIIPNMLDDVLYRDRLNDISFLLGGKLVVLVEHQSTINYNMPLRLLKYIADLYDGMLVNGQRYRQDLVSLPWPEFVILYNGEEPLKEDAGTMSLSDAFRKNSEKLKSFGIDTSKAPPLELTAKVYNINEGHNIKILKASRTLQGYSIFIAKVREYEREIANGRRIYELSKLVRQEALRKGVDWCIENDIIKDFLEKHRKEVTDMLYDEWDFDQELEVAKQLAWEEGEEHGLEKGLEKGREETVRNAVMLGLAPDVIQKLTGLNTQIISNIAHSITRTSSGS